MKFKQEQEKQSVRMTGKTKRNLECRETAQERWPARKVGLLVFFALILKSMDALYRSFACGLFEWREG